MSPSPKTAWKGKTIFNYILDLIYPPVCGICGKIDKNSLCNKCNLKVKKEAVFGVDEYCETQDKLFDEHLYVFIYSGIIRNAILNYKFNNKSYIYKTITKFLLKNEKFVEIIKSYDIIIPVPLSKKRMKERGYNQSELIAKEISKTLNIDLNKQSLIKNQNTVAQSTLNKEERLKNSQGVYTLKYPNKITNKNVLIIDDIYTTGSTVNECSKKILKANPEKIGVLTIAKD